MSDAFTKALEAHTREDMEVAKHNDLRFQHIEDTLANVTQELKDMREENKQFRDEIMEAIRPLTEAYQGVLFGKKVLTGLSAVVLAFATIGGGILYLGNLFKN